MSIRRPDPRTLAGDDGERDPLASAVWIRPFRSDDATAVRELVEAVLGEFDLAAGAGADDLRDIEATYRLRGGEFWVVEDGRGRLTGTCGLWVDPADRGRCEIRRMYLLAAARGRGLGRRLLQTALDQARRVGASRVELETASRMKAAISLYRSAGFVESSAESPSGGCDRRFGLDL